MKKFGCIYMITNKLTNKKYIGQTVQSISRRFNAHCVRNVKSAIHLAIEKYGKDNFKIEEIVSCFSMDAMNDIEEELIKFHNTMTPNGYNLISGGRNRIPS
jgi:group I intron endonuclease